jgi:hypothetical protein
VALLQYLLRQQLDQALGIDHNAFRRFVDAGKRSLHQRTQADFGSRPAWYADRDIG